MQKSNVSLQLDMWTMNWSNKAIKPLHKSISNKIKVLIQNQANSKLIVIKTVALAIL